MRSRRHFLRSALALAAGATARAAELAPSVVITNCAKVRIPNGRWLSYSECGDLAGSRVVIHQHGLPSCRLETVIYPKILCRYPGVRILGVDRPGIGRSTPDPCASILSWPADLFAFADALGINRFATIAPSAGAPYALAAARACPQRVRGVVLVGPIVPNELVGRRTGTGSRGIRFTERAPRLTALLMASAARTERSHPNRPKLSDINTPPTSREILRDPKIKEDFRQIKIETFHQGAVPVVRNVLQVACPWAHWLGEVTVPVTIFEGCEDSTIPPKVIHLLADRLPNAQVIFVPGEGHLSLPERHTDHILDAALASLE